MKMLGSKDALGLNWGFRTFLRIGLVIAGVVFLFWWTETGDSIDLILGLLAVVVGAAGLWLERTDSPES